MAFVVGSKFFITRFSQPITQHDGKEHSELPTALLQEFVALLSSKKAVPHLYMVTSKNSGDSEKNSQNSQKTDQNIVTEVDIQSLLEQKEVKLPIQLPTLPFDHNPFRPTSSQKRGELKLSLLKPRGKAVSGDSLLQEVLTI